MRWIFSGLMAFLLAGPVWAEPRFAVGHVAADDVLNVRAAPSVDFDILQELPPGTGDLRKEICVFVKPDPLGGAPAKMPEWCLISDRSGPLGWVNARFLVKDTTPGPAPDVLRLMGGYRSYDDPCRMVGETRAVVDYLDHLADLVACPIGNPGIEALSVEMGAREVLRLEGYVLLSILRL